MMKVEHDDGCPLREFVYELGSGKDIPLCECDRFMVKGKMMSDLPKVIYVTNVEKGDKWYNDIVYASTHGAKKHPQQETTKYIRADLVPQWQPIETAPRDGDGERVLIQEPSYNKKFSVLSIAYFVKKHSLEDYTGEMDIEFMEEHNEVYYWPEGWYSADNGNDELVIKCNPTHWMPLPEPPKED
jgi:hypothetical protein